MTWRRFITLLGGLSGDSIFIQTLVRRKEEKESIIEDVNSIVGDMLGKISKK